jgi:hypothetical protein
LNGQPEPVLPPVALRMLPLRFFDRERIPNRPEKYLPKNPIPISFLLHTHLLGEFCAWAICS